MGRDRNAERRHTAKERAKARQQRAQAGVATGALACGWLPFAGHAAPWGRSWKAQWGCTGDAGSRWAGPRRGAVLCYAVAVVT